MKIGSAVADNEPVALYEPSLSVSVCVLWEWAFAHPAAIGLFEGKFVGGLFRSSWLHVRRSHTSPPARRHREELCREKSGVVFLHPPCPGCRSASVWKQEMTETKCIQISRDVFCLWCPHSSGIRVPASGGGCWLAGRSVKSPGRLRPAAFLVTMDSMRSRRFWWYLQWKEKQRSVSADSY